MTKTEIKTYHLRMEGDGNNMRVTATEPTDDDHATFTTPEAVFHIYGDLPIIMDVYLGLAIGRWLKTKKG